MKGTAQFSDCLKFRYTLTRDWSISGEEKKNILFLMLNPSTADADIFDPTVKRCFNYAKRWGYNHMTVCNIYAYRATNPKDMLRAKEEGINIIGQHNDSYIWGCAMEAQKIICAWGASPWSRDRAKEVIQVLERYCGEKLFCLKKSKDGCPVHPLYQKNDLIPAKFPKEN